MKKPPYDIEAIKQTTDLLALIEHDLGPGKKSTRWYLFHCPFPGHAHGDKNPSLAVTPDNGRYHCFTCGRSGDCITWVMEREGLPFREACERLSAETYRLQSPAPLRQAVPEHDQPPGDAWQNAAWALVEAAEANLWDPVGARVLSYLHNKRGLTDQTIKRYRLGYIPMDQQLPPEEWGYPPDSAPIMAFKGITIPGIIGSTIWYIKLRRPKGETPKYINIRGGRAALFGADNLRGADLILLCEGEFDAMLASQQIGDVIGCATLASATKTIDLATWGGYLLQARRVFAAYDMDQAGEAGAKKLADMCGNVRRIELPSMPKVKDITDFYQAGGDLWQWLKASLST